MMPMAICEKCAPDNPRRGGQGEPYDMTGLVSWWCQAWRENGPVCAGRRAKACGG